MASGSRIRPLTIPRIGAGYHDCVPQGEIASATGIRQLHARGEDLSPFIPLSAQPFLQQALLSGNLLDPSLHFPLLMTRLSDEPAALAGIYQVEDGIAERLCQHARTAHNFFELIDSVKVRHLTVSRLQRILAYILLNLANAEVEEQLAFGPPYLRLLGATAKGEHFLAATRKKRTLPLLANFSRSTAQLKKFYGEKSPAFAGPSLCCIWKREQRGCIPSSSRSGRGWTGIVIITKLCGEMDVVGQGQELLRKSVDIPVIDMSEHVD